MELKEIFKGTKEASYELTSIDDKRRNDILQAVAESILEHQNELLKANLADLARMDSSTPL